MSLADTQLSGTTFNSDEILCMLAYFEVLLTIILCFTFSFFFFFLFVCFFFFLLFFLFFKYNRLRKIKIERYQHKSHFFFTMKILRVLYHHIKKYNLFIFLFYFICFLFYFNTITITTFLL